MLNLRGLGAVVFCLLVAIIASPGAAVQNVDDLSIEGDWKAISIVFWGEKWAPAKTDLMTIRIRRETFEFAGMPDENGKFFAMGMQYTVRRDAGGLLIDLRFIDGKYEGFCRFDEDGRLGVCWSPKGLPRPLGFVEKPNEKRSLLVLERITKQ